MLSTGMIGTQMSEGGTMRHASSGNIREARLENGSGGWEACSQ
jgi:hypothetical protein